MTHPTLRSQRGVTLIELMVGLTIGLLVVLAATGTIVLNRTSANTVSDTAAVTSQANNVMRQIAYLVRQAGAFELQPTDTGAAAASQVFNLADPASTAPVAVTGVNGTSGASDEVTFGFANRGAAVTRDCLGNLTNTIHAQVPNRFFVNAGNLNCQGLAGNAAQSMAQNVEDFQVLYLTEVGAGLQWLDAAQVIALGATTWNRVVAVDLCLQIRGEVNHGSLLVGNYVNCANTQTAHSNFFRVVLRQTVQLRNRMNNL